MTPTHEPRVERRAALTYCALPVEVTMESLGARVPDAVEELERYMASRGIQPAGPSLIRYRTVREDAPFTIEVGWVTEPDIWIDAPFVADVLPDGSYATLTHEGAYANLSISTAQLLAWSRTEGVVLDATPSPDGDEWQCWYELYLEDPAVGPDGLGGPVEIGLLTTRA